MALEGTQTKREATSEANDAALWGQRRALWNDYIKILCTESSERNREYQKKEQEKFLRHI